MGSEKCGSADAGDRARVARWLSQGFEDLLYHLGPRQSAPADTYDFDVVIVGSGYGGAIAAEQLAGRIDNETGEEVRLCVLERGREYLSGMFPVSEAQLPGHLRITAANGPKIRGIVDGLFDMRVGPDVCALLANGLGGGSLINAGVMLRPSEKVLSSDAWPKNLRGANVLSKYYDEAETLLTSVQAGRFNHFGDRPAETVPLKFRALSDLGGKSVPLSIAIEGGTNAAGVELRKCIRCGDCATGCNHQAKNSLDQNCLVMARRKGAQIFCGATVLKLERLEEPRPERPLEVPRRGWKLHVVHTDPDLRRRGRPCELVARRVILAAGTFGSTEILLRSRSSTLRFSRCLGQRFSTNGDLLAVAYNQRERVNAVALETDAFCKREIGPTITGMIDQRDTEGVAIQEFAIPGALRRLFVESFAIAHTFYRLSQRGDRHFHRSGKPDPCGVSQEAIDRTQVFGLMGDDGAAGTLQLVPGCTDECTDGAIRVHWSSLRDGSGNTVFDAEARLLRQLVENSGQGGEVLPNPVWRLLPSGLESIVDIPRGPALTVHPLGGCSMADSIRYGVVDDCGRVFNPDKAAEDSHYDDLVVLDGSVIPRALGINPALTIAAVTLRAVGELRKAWMGPAEPIARAEPRRLPPLADIKVPDCVPTEISILERMTGKVWLKLKNSEPEERVVELTMTFRRHRLDQLNASLTRRLDVDGSSRIRIFEPKCYQELWDTGASEARFDACAKFIAPLAGQMRLLDREASTVFGRTWRALVAYLLNRGTRDLWQMCFPDPSRKRVVKLRQFLKGVGAFRVFASHAGETRLFEYELTIGTPRKGESPVAKARSPESYPREMVGQRIRGCKRLTYSLRCNPWRQLTEMKLEIFPNLVPNTSAVLTLEPKFYAREEKHLLQIDKQRDQATALFELASFMLCCLRILLTTHIWSFRRPDAPSSLEPCRLPGSIPGLPEPEINEIEVGDHKRPARIRLTRYAKRGAKPVVMIHGFSANGTTFAHPALDPSLADYLWNEGRDVWVLDLRTSSGMRTASEPWDFEQVAGADIPAAFAFIQCATQQPKIDVITQCMGAAMLSMAVLDIKASCTRAAGDPHPELTRAAFLDSLGSVVLSQIAPLIVFTATNIYRAYVVSFVQNALEARTFELRPEEGLGSHLLDRLLSSVPYPDGEFRIENPVTPWKRTPFVGTRHRMDAWFGRVLNIENVAPEVLEHIDDMFGTINLDTTFQTIPFARSGMITTRSGRNAFVTPETLDFLKKSKIPVLSIHGSDNGLADVATVTRMKFLMESIKGRYHFYIAEGLGHQDCMIGRDAGKEVFPQILKFLKDPDHYESTKLPKGACGSESLEKGPVAQAPWLGPILGERSDGLRKIAVAANPRLADPSAIAIVAVEMDDDRRWRMKGELSEDNLTWLGTPIFCGPAVPDAQGWYEANLSESWYETEAVLILLVYRQAPILRKPPWYDALSQADSPLDFPGLIGKLPTPEVASAVAAYLKDAPTSELEAALMKRPRPEAGKSEPLRFAAASCQYPPGPLDPTLAGASYERLGKLLDESNGPEFLVLAGDQVYVDATKGLMDPSVDDDRYELPYEKFLRMRAVRSVLKRLPMYAMLDDHEINDNWEPGAQDDADEIARQLNEPKAAYRKFQRILNSPEQEVMWYAKTLRGFPFFFADTRTERTARSAPHINDARIMSVGQFDELTHWLTAHKKDPVPMFVITPSILLPRRLTTLCSKASALRSDAWDGFPHSQRRLLAHIALEQIHNVVFLSGDEHHSCIATVTLTPVDPSLEDVVIHSIHSSGLYAPYVFANGSPEELAGKETFFFVDPQTKRRIRCQVQTEFIGPTIGSFAVITCTRETPKSWQLDCKFHTHDGIRPGRQHEIRVSPVPAAVPADVPA